MGKITIFALSTCKHCKHAKSILAEKGAEYVNIDVGLYPEKRKDMTALTQGKVTVPQIFFGDKYIGGASDIDALRDAGTLDVAIKEALEGPDPTKVELIPPDYAPKEEDGPSPRNEETVCVLDACVPFAEMNATLIKELPVKDHHHGGVTHRNSFTGHVLVDFLMKKYSIEDRAEAVKIGEFLENSNFFQSVTGKQGFEDTRQLYRLRAQLTPAMLNTWRTWTDRVDDPMVVVRACKTLLNKIQTKHTSEKGVDYVAMGQDAEYAKTFQDAVCEFQKIDILDMKEDTRIAFTINLYNLLIIHAFVQVGIATSDWQRLSYFDLIGYNIGGNNYSLNDLENGILRGNKTAPYHFSKPFSTSDPRAAAALPQAEHRIHFALNCGAKSCPPISEFTADNLQEELNLAAKGFCESDDAVRVDEEAHTVWLTKIVSWYSSDFGSNKREILTTISKYLGGKKKEVLDKWLADDTDINIKYYKYDWSTNAINHKPFSARSLKPDSTTCSVM
eukprot:m.69194 g.69194  ORF g.69194 m.69194 type:complete len:503 (+) comp12031_c1_seq1:366-1874(+)